METKSRSRAPGWLVGLLVALFLLSLSWFIYSNYRANDMPLSQQWGMLLSSTLLLAVPVGLLYFAIGLLVMAYQQKLRDGRTSGWVARWVYRTPRIAGVLISIFVGLFALDVFEMDAAIGEKIIAFLIHASPAILLGIAVALAWRWDWVGVFVFSAMALVFLRFVIGSPSTDWIGNLLIFNLPMAAIAFLFWANWRWRGETRPG